MNNKHIIYLLTILLFIVPTLSQAGFDWGGSGGNCSGSGNFQQQIKNYDTVEVGEIPAGKEGVYIKLISSEDVDIQLYDQVTGDKIIVWPDGILNKSYKQTTDYKGISIEWSGYNGDGKNYGHEYIKISGITNRTLVMKAFGYQAGFADVDYSWTGTQGCSETGGVAANGSGTFQQAIVKDNIVTVGDIPTGLNNLSIKLISDEDVDIQLYDRDNGTKIIVWPDGILSDGNKQNTNYQGMNIEWSGYNGDGTGWGHEYIKISGATTRNLTMKAFGYQAGFATVNYVWGGGTTSGNPSSCQASFSSTDYSHLCWLFDEVKSASAWHLSGNGVGQGDHRGDDYYADDWNYGGGSADLGKNLNSASAGTVIYAADSGTGYGKQVIVQTSENSDFAIRYTHLDSIAVSRGQSVSVGTLLGTIGDSGLPKNQCSAAYGWVCPHLHLVVYKNINQISRSNQTALYWLKKGKLPVNVSGGASNFAAWFDVVKP